MKGLDIAFSQPAPQWWQARHAEGYRVVVQNLWTGGFASNDGIRAVAAPNIRNARAAGLAVAAYVNASPPNWWPLDLQMQNIRENAGSEWPNVTKFCVDVEIPGITKARVMELADALEAEGKTVDVLYTGRWFWVGHMGNSRDSAWLRFKLWSADYDGVADLATSTYGPWTAAHVIGKQYAGTTYIGGHAVDLNEFTEDFLAEEDDVNLQELEDKLRLLREDATRRDTELTDLITELTDLIAVLRGDATKTDSELGEGLALLRKNATEADNEIKARLDTLEARAQEVGLKRGDTVTITGELS